MGGGPSPEQQAAAASTSALDTKLSNAYSNALTGWQSRINQTQPFYQNQMQNGLPYAANVTDAQSGNTAQAFAPARAQLERTLGQSPNALPSGFATGARTDLASQQARAYDQAIQGFQAQNYGAKQAGAAGLMGQAQILNPTQFSGQAIQGGNSIMQAPLASPGLGGLLGGMAGGLLSALPF